MSIDDAEDLNLSNIDLNEAMQAIAERDTPERRPLLYEALLNSVLIVPTPDPEEGNAGLASSEENDDLVFLTFEGDEGGTVLIAFTSEDAALNWEPEGLTYIGLRGSDLFLIATENQVTDMVLNPAGPNTLLIGEDEIAALSQGEIPADTEGGARPVTDGMTVLIGAPEEEPPASWREELNKVLRQYPSIEAAYFFQLHIPPAGPRHVVGLVLYEGMSGHAQDSLIETMMEEFEALLPEEQELDFVVLDEPSFRQTVEDTVSPIYTG